MQIGVVFPQTEIGEGREALRRYATDVESFGFAHLLAYDHILGADPQVHAPWSGPYDIDTTFHEPFVLFGHLSAICSLELVTGIIILPQRQTALVAKQAAAVDIFTGGKFRLGVGLGWNSVEYEALGKEFHDRGRRIGEQVQLLRKLTSERSVNIKGVHESVIGAGIAPLPIQRPIPIWFGANTKTALSRAGRLAVDGWFPPAAARQRPRRAPRRWSTMPPEPLGAIPPRSAWKAARPSIPTTSTSCGAVPPGLGARRERANASLNTMRSRPERSRRASRSAGEGRKDLLAGLDIGSGETHSLG